MRPDKKKVIDEVWDDDRIEGFLHKGPFGAETNLDFSVLLHAYRSMRAEDFGRFIDRFSAAGRDLNARNRRGETLLAAIAGHQQSAEFRTILTSAGAQL